MTLTETIAAVVRTARDRDVTFMAAGFAHYAFASIVPLLLVALAAASFVGEGRFVRDLIAGLGSTLTPSARRVLVRLLTATSGRAGAGIVGLIAALWSGLKVFRGLKIAFASVYDAEAAISLSDQVRDGVVVLSLIALALVAMTLSGIVASFVDLPVAHPALASAVVLFSTFVLAFLPIYYVLPPVPVSLREVLPGTLFAALGWLVLQFGFALYTRVAGEYAAYGLLGAVLLFVTWLYVGGIVLLLGAVVNAVLARETPLATLRAPR
ncbi:YihY/virulence factor BrkB family protein [Halegenticoccus tardaugens]|uniref:YihY/virulence factor BrkB family protein n=1 Tax=Halegenticoccus tardaugens TaxID=2071624 RepID=UPI00100AD541|nr:YihY/virulence factor BrkB family protein [Halegenticoccus tardaugens]